MKSWLSRSSIILFTGALIVACSNGGTELVAVSSETYDSRACWFDRQGDFVAFLALARDGQLAVPYFVSTNCLVRGYTSYGEATLLHLGTIRMIDSHGSLQRAFPEVRLSGNVRTDLPLPSSDSKLYYFRAQLATVPSEHIVIYAPRNITQLTDMNMQFERFLGLSREEREGLLNEYNGRP